MTPQQAIAFLDKAVQTVNTTREGHIKLQEAINVIEKMVREKEEKTVKGK